MIRLRGNNTKTPINTFALLPPCIDAIVQTFFRLKYIYLSTEKGSKEGCKDAIGSKEPKSARVQGCKGLLHGSSREGSIPRARGKGTGCEGGVTAFKEAAS